MIQRRKDTVRHVWVQCHLYEAYIPFSSHFDQFIIIHPVLHTCGKTMKKHTLLLISAQNLVSWFSALTIGASRENEPLWVQEVLYGIKKEGKVWRFSSSTFIMNGCQRRQKKVQNQHQAISVFRGGGCNEKRSIKWRHFMHRHSNMSHCVLFFFFWCLYVTTKLIFSKFDQCTEVNTLINQYLLRMHKLIGCPE